MKRYCLLPLLLLAFCFINADTLTSPFATGHWMKLSITESGVYKLPFDSLRAWGFDNPEMIAVYGVVKKFYHMDDDTLPKLKEIPLQLISEGNKQYYRTFFMSAYQSQYYKNVKYTDYTESQHGDYYYFITTSNTTPPTIDTIIPTLPDSVYMNFNIGMMGLSCLDVLGSGHPLKQKAFTAYPAMDYLDNEPRDSGDYFFSDNAINLFFKNAGDDSVFMQINESIFNLGPPGGSKSIRYSLPYFTTVDSIKIWSNKKDTELILNRVLLSARMPYHFYTGQYFAIGETSDYYGTPKKHYYICKDQQPEIWNIKDNQIPYETFPDITNDTLTIRYNTTDLSKNYVIFNSDSLLLPKASIIENVDILNLSPTESIIITADEYYTQGLKLAEIHENYDHISSLVIKQTDIYNVYSGGRPYPEALRHFCLNMAEKAKLNELTLNYITLLGEGIEGDMTINTNTLMPSASSSACGDIFVGILNESIPSVNDAQFLQPHLSAAVGRIPAKTLNDAQTYVNKLSRRYEGLKYPNHKQLIVCDKYESSRNSSFIDTVEQYFAASPNDYPNTIVHKHYRTEAQNDSLFAPTISHYLNQGIGLLLYSGHSDHWGWNNKLMQSADVLNLYNKHYPILISGGCESATIGIYDDNIAHHWLFNPNGGAIAIMGTTVAIGNAETTRFLSHFYDAWEENDNIRLGDVYKETWNSMTDTSQMYVLRHIVLLGDPLLPYHFPNNKIEIVRHNAQTLDIRIVNQYGMPIQVFDGTVNLNIYASSFERATSAPTPEIYTVLDSISYSSSATVLNGEARIPLPKNLQDNDAMHLFALSEDIAQEAYSVYNSPLSITDVLPDSNDWLFESPFRNTLTITPSIKFDDDFIVQLITVNGNTIKQQSSYGYSPLTLDTEMLIPGLYILGIKYKNTFRIYKVVKI